MTGSIISNGSMIVFVAHGVLAIFVILGVRNLQKPFTSTFPNETSYIKVITLQEICQDVLMRRDIRIYLIVLGLVRGQSISVQLTISIVPPLVGDGNSRSA